MPNVMLVNTEANMPLGIVSDHSVVRLPSLVSNGLLPLMGDALLHHLRHGHSTAYRCRPACVQYLGRRGTETAPGDGLLS